MGGFDLDGFLSSAIMPSMGGFVLGGYALGGFSASVDTTRGLFTGNIFSWKQFQNVSPHPYLQASSREPTMIIQIRHL